MKFRSYGSRSEWFKEGSDKYIDALNHSDCVELDIDAPTYNDSFVVFSVKKPLYTHTPCRTTTLAVDTEFFRIQQAFKETQDRLDKLETKSHV